jgi:hypothetical protein
VVATATVSGTVGSSSSQTAPHSSGNGASFAGNGTAVTFDRSGGTASVTQSDGSGMLETTASSGSGDIVESVLFVPLVAVCAVLLFLLCIGVAGVCWIRRSVRSSETERKLCMFLL